MVKLISKIKQTTQLKWNRVGSFKPKIQFELKIGAYTVKTADSVDELLQVFKLRHIVFHQEFREIATPGLDIDKFDRVFDHLIIHHGPSDQIIGTYRLRATQQPGASYTAQEFNLGHMHEVPGPYLELGRACIQQEHRKGAVISLLFRGIAEYMNKSGAQILFGCSSVKTKNPREAALIYRYLENLGAIETSLSIHPTMAFKMPGMHGSLMDLSGGLSPEETTRAEGLLPALIKSYVKMGAKIAGVPAYDKDFACIDLLTLLRRDDLAVKLAKKFQVVST